QVKDASFEVRRGEIVGVAGLVGAGRTELVRAVFGADKADRGEVEIRGRVGLLGSPAAAIRERAALVPEDRKVQGLLIDQPIDQNVTLAGQAASGGFWLRSGRDRATVRKLIGDLRIKAPFPWQGVSSLSGGNQQKVVLAKWLATEPEVLILDEPTRGIDIGTKFELYGLIDKLAAGGTAVLLVSSELPELLALTDRTLVMRNGGIVAEIPHELASEEAILAAAVGEAGMAGTAAG
ncbi:MAG TPA: ATP-binding cassette domain-containing protein, partial [Thermomicrobiales bacterium]|nr:ATP-binding cassette domain-containing protein [Thermomicrobiales bacterium]